MNINGEIMHPRETITCVSIYTVYTTSERTAFFLLLLFFTGRLFMLIDAGLEIGVKVTP